MPNKKEVSKDKDLSLDEKLDLIIAKSKEHEKVLANFRTSFQNLETALSRLKERNRLR